MDTSVFRGPSAASLNPSVQVFASSITPVLHFSTLFISSLGKGTGGAEQDHLLKRVANAACSGAKGLDVVVKGGHCTRVGWAGDAGDAVGHTLGTG